MAYLGNAPIVGDSTNSFKLLDDIASFTLTFDATDTSVVSISGDTLSFTNHRFVTGQKVTYTDGGGTAIGGLTDGTSYFIIKVDQNTIKLATNASNAASSTAINLTSGAAGGSHTLKVAFDGVNTKFKATFNNGKKAKISRAAQISLSINGVIQQPQDSSSPSVGYGVEADSTIVFSTAPVATDKVFASFIGEVAASFDITDNTIDNFTGDGSTTIFNLSKEVPSSQDVLVTLDGVTQHPSDGSTTRSYSVINQALTFVSAPATGVAIQARHIGFAGATTSAVTGFYGRTGNAALTSTDDISVQNISGVGATFTSNVNIEGVLTYEDVTNVDSIGIITARAGVLVGSGITLSKDGDGFFTGIVTATSFSGSGTNLTGIDTDLVSDTSPQLGGNLDVNTKNIVFGDSGGATDDRLTFGAGTDLSIYHDGTHSNIVNTNTSGYISVNTDNFRVQDDNGSENILRGFANGAVELYHDNSKKFETTSGGVSITGNCNVDGNITLSDNEEIQIGNSTDFRIYHDGNNTFLRDVGAGSLSISGSQVSFDSSNLAEYMVRAIENGAVELYHDGTKMIETISTGTNIPDGKFARFGNSNDMSMGHNTYNYITYTGADLLITGDATNQIKLMPKSDEAAIVCKPNAEVELYYDGTMHFETQTNGVKIDSGGDTILEMHTSNGTAHSRINFSNNSGNDYGGIWYGANNSLEFRTNNGERARFDLSGRLLLNTTSSFDSNYRMSTYLTSTGGHVFRPDGTSTRYPLGFQNSSAAYVGSVQITTSSTSYNTSSDYRLKENEVTISDAISKVKQLKPYTFNFKINPDQKIDGFFAHEAQEVVPYAVSGEKDNEDMMQQLDYGKLTPLLTAALQEAVTEIESLKSRLDAAGL